MLLRLCLFVLPCAIACVAATITGSGDGTGEKVILPPTGFLADLAGWVRSGPAEFAQDSAHAREGHPSARIAVVPGAELKYQQVRRDLSADIRPGDEFRAAAYVSSEGVTEDPGAYLALAFLGNQGERVGIAHSRMGAGIGRLDWEKLEATGTAPEGTRSIRLSLILHAHGTAWFAEPEIVRTGRMDLWPDLGNSTRIVTIHPAHVVQAHFGGVGFHAFQHDFPASADEMDQVIYKRWRELRPTFARLNHGTKWDRTKLDQVAKHIQRMKECGTQVYLTTWDPEDARTPGALAAYARKVVDSLEYLVRTKGLDNIRWYCMTNELSLGGWGKLASDLPTFKAYQEAIHRELRARSLPIGLLATDASPIDYWPTLEWATKNMDGVTAIYGGHHYVEQPLDDERFYPWFLGRVEWATGLARAKGKDFILGEFGAKQDGRKINGVLQDRCVWFDTPQEPLIAIQVAEAAIAAINAGAFGMGYWTFMDLPDDFASGYINKWGTFRCSGADRSTRPLYYGYALLTRYFRGPAAVVKVDSSDPRLRAAAARQTRGAWSIAIVNRNKQPAPLRIGLEGGLISARFRKYVYDPAHPPSNPFGDLPGPNAVVPMKDGILSDTVGRGTLTVYTTDYRAQMPRAVSGVRVSPENGQDRLTWNPGTESVCYYRVYRSKVTNVPLRLADQIGSTTAVHLTASSAGGPWHYRVVAVDESGNPGPPSRAVTASSARP